MKRVRITVLAVLLLSLAGYTSAACLLDILDESVGAWDAGVPRSFQLTPCCGTPPYTFSVHSGAFPAGLSMTSGGLISGTSPSPTNSLVCIKLTDSVGCSVTRCYDIYVF